MNDNNTLADDLRTELEDERRSSLALMKLLADEKHKSDRLEAELAIYKGREEGKQRIIEQLEASLRDALTRTSLETKGEQG